MSPFTVHAADMLRRPSEARSEALRLSILCAFGQLAIEGRTPLCRDTLSPCLKGFIALNPSDVLLPGVSHLVLSWTEKTTNAPAACEIEVSMQQGVRRAQSQIIKVLYPDQLLGLEGLLGEDSRHRISGLYFNLTPGQLVGDLFGAIAPVCTAFALTESLRAEAEPALLIR